MEIPAPFFLFFIKTYKNRKNINVELELMNTDFRILLEDTFNFKGGRLYIMLLVDNGMFGVEVVNREKTFGRKFSDDRKSAEFLFNSIKDRLCLYDKLTDAENAITQCFNLDSMNKLLFALIMGDRITSQSDIVSIRDKFEHIIRLKFGYKKKNKDLNGLTIYVYESRNSKKPFGMLYGTDMANDMQFELF